MSDYPAKCFGLWDQFPFGKHQGEMIGTVIEEDPEYIQWLLDKTDHTLDGDALRYFEEGS